jgi:K+-sensing histidine kinase KdpD
LHSIVLYAAFNSTFYFGAYFTEQYFTLRLHLIVLFTLVLVLLSSTLLATFHIINIMSQHHEQQQERSRLKNQTKALYQATRRANPVVRSLKQSSDSGRKRIASEEPGVREQRREQEQEQPANTRQRAEESLPLLNFPPSCAFYSVSVENTIMAPFLQQLSFLPLVST